MNDIFSWRRLGRLAIRHYTEYGKSYMWSIIGLFLFYILVYLWWGSVGDSMKNGKFLLDLVGFYGVAAAYVWMTGYWIMKPYTRKSLKAVTSWTLPASMIEKYLFAWFNSMVICLLICICCLSIVNYAGDLLCGVQFSFLSLEPRFTISGMLVFVLMATFMGYIALRLSQAMVVLVYGFYLVARFSQVSEWLFFGNRLLLSESVIAIVLWSASVFLLVLGYLLFRKYQLR